MKTSHIPSKISIPIVYLHPDKVTKYLLGTIAALFFLSFLEKIIVNWLNATADNQIIPRFFVFDMEYNFPSLYSALGLLFCSYLLAMIATIKKPTQYRYTKSWTILSFIFMYLAIDELCSIHELLIPILRNVFDAQGIFFFPWVIPAFILLIVFLIVFRDFIVNLPKKTKILFLLAGGVYVGGAMGMELIDGYFADVLGFDTKAYWIASTIEELLEMLGIVIFIYGLLSYIQDNRKTTH
jgi:hypothetical protein